MSDFLKEAASYFAEISKELATPVTYTRKVNNKTYSVEIMATKGKTPFRTLDKFFTSRIIKSSDFIFNTEDLILNQEQTLPLERDIILEGGDKFEVLGINNEPHWTFSDPTRQRIRVHTKKIGVT